MTRAGVIVSAGDSFDRNEDRAAKGPNIFFGLMIP